MREDSFVDLSVSAQLCAIGERLFALNLGSIRS